METSAANSTQEQTHQRSNGSNNEPIIRHCEKHGPWEVKYVVDSFSGTKRYTMHCPKCREEKEREEEERRRRMRIESWIRNANFPMRHEYFSFGDFSTQTEEQKFALKVARRYAEKFPEHCKAGRSLVLTGRPGTGKTSLACAIGRTIIESLIPGEGLLSRQTDPVLYSTEHSILRDIKGTWRRNAEFTEEQVVEHFSAVGLLIIDEIGVSGNSDTDKALIHQVIDGRYGCVKPTLIIGNLTPEELNQHLGERIMDRLKEGGGVIVPFTWKSFRG